MSKSFTLVCAILVALAFAYWSPTLLQGQTISQNDSVIVGAPILDLLSRGLRGTADLTWTQGLFGGHPLFAEGQGGFLSPLNLAVAALVVPFKGAVYGLNVYEFLTMIWVGLGTLGLCRALGASIWASGLAAFAVAFSPAWIMMQTSLPVLGTVSMAPWCFWGMEAWLKRPTIRSATLFGLATALVLLAGYPQGFHGAVIYMALRLAVVPFQPQFTRDGAWRPIAATGAWAVAIGVGAAAIQWMPLLELTGLSHRSNGIGLIFPIKLPAIAFVRGFLFTPQADDGWIGLQKFSTGSPLICALALLTLALRTPASAKGHALAVLVLAQLGMGVSSPVFRLIYRNHLIPGLHFFRVMNIYTEFAVIGVACLAALGADALVAAAADSKAGVDASRAWRLALVAVVWVAAAAVTWSSRLDLLQVAVAVVGLVGAGLLAARGAPKLAPVLLALLLCLEVGTLRLRYYKLIDAATLATPGSVQTIESTPDSRLYSSYENTTFGVFMAVPPTDPITASMARNADAALVTASNLRWGIASIRGNFSLPLRRAVSLQPQLQAEATGQSPLPPGARLIDLLSVKFLSTASDALPAPATTLLWRDPSGVGARMFVNQAARPRFQLFASAVPVASPDAALASLLAARAPALFVEGAPSVAASAPGAVGQVQVLAARDASSVLRVTSAAPAWLFMADADYPGWRAFVDGRETPIYAAQVLGKAIQVPAGTHEVRFAFRSLTVETGALITALTLALSAVLIGLSFRRPRTAPAG